MSMETDFKSLLDLKAEMEIPEETEATVRKMLYVDLVPYPVMREILQKGKTVANITAMDYGIKQGLSVKRMLEVMVDDELELSIALFDALRRRIPKSLLAELRDCRISPAIINQIVSVYSKEKEKGIRLCMQEEMDVRQVDIILRILKGENGYERAKVVADPNLDWFQMQMIERFYCYGMTSEEAEQLVKPYKNCKEMMELGEYILSSR